MHRIRRPALLLALTGLLSSCALDPFESPGPAPGGEEGGASESVEIRVMNLNFNDARLWLIVRGGQRQLLGTVTGKGNDSFTVPWRLSAPAAIEIDLLSGGRCTSEELMLDPGDLLDFQIPVAFDGGSRCRW